MRKFSEITIGERAFLNHVVTKEDVERFVEFSGDDNKLHVDENFASKTKLRRTVAHGMIGASFVSRLIGTQLPGDGALWVSQKLEFLAPVYVGDKLLVSVEVTKKFDRQRVIELGIEIKNQNRKLLVKGLSKVQLLEETEEEESSEETNNQKVALVVGGSGEIGSAICLKLASENFFVFIHYFTNEKMALKIECDIKAAGGQAATIKADVTKVEDIEFLANRIRRRFGAVNVLVNCCASKIPTIEFRELKWEDFQDQLNLQLKSVFDVTRKCFDLLKSASAGKVINIGTMAFDKPVANWCHYITAKGALVGLTRAMAYEFGRHNIRVNIVSPGLIESESMSAISGKLKLIAAQQNALKRIGTVKDIAGIVCLLAADNSNFLTGQNIRANGGELPA